MASVHKDRFIILKTIKFGESDLIVHGLGRSGEKTGFMAKGARKSRKRFGGGVLEPTHYVELTYKSKTNHTELGQLSFLDDARLINGFNGVRADYDRLQMGLYFVHLYDRVSVEGVVESEYGFNLLGNALKQLESSQDIGLLKTQFELKFLHQQGVLPPEMSQKDFIGRPLSDHLALMEEYQDGDLTGLQKIRSQLNQFIHSYVY